MQNSNTFYHEAVRLCEQDICPLPFKGKMPNLKTWKPYQEKRPTREQLDHWHKQGLFQNIGIVLGSVSQNLVVLDTDGAAGLPAFEATFPQYASTRTILTGGGVGHHKYFYSDELPDTVKAMDTPLGHIELRSNGCCVVAPPSVTDNSYTVLNNAPILQVSHLKDVVEWIDSFNPISAPNITWKPPKVSPSDDKSINPEVIQAIATTLSQQRHKVSGDWLNCSCPYPEKHSNGDRNPSFGFNTATGYGHCYVCGTLLAKDICERLGIEPRDYGGLIKAAPVTVVSSKRPSTVQPPSQPPPPTPSLPPIGQIDLPKWLAEYVRWSSQIANQTPYIFHLGMGLWMGSIAIARRLYVQSYWGQRIFPNLYMMFVGPTTFYRKTTALDRGKDIINASIPHMLMGTPGSPERFQDALAGQKPRNFEELDPIAKNHVREGNKFSGQRGLLKDEIGGLFGSFKRDHMAGMKDFVLDIYECPDSLVRETQAGQFAVSNVYIPILGVTTPTGLVANLQSYSDWESGLLPRFLLLTPEPSYKERPHPKAYIPPPASLATGLKKLHEELPAPEKIEGHWQPPSPVQMVFENWSDVKEYGDYLRELTDPRIENELDSRLRGTYGRMHVQAIKIAQICAAFDWMEGGTTGAPTVTRKHWEISRTLTEHFRMSAHRLLEQLQEKHSARQERSTQDRVLRVYREAGPSGMRHRETQRKLGLTSHVVRQASQELCRAGLLEEYKDGRAEAYRFVDQ